MRRINRAHRCGPSAGATGEGSCPVIEKPVEGPLEKQRVHKVLASSVLAADAVDNGLLQVYRSDIRLPGMRYRAVCVPGRERLPRIKVFLDWLKRETAVD